MNASLALLLALATTGGHRVTLVTGGAEPAPGLLVNRTIGVRPFDPPDPSRSTVVFIHGMNPIPGLVRLAEAIARRYGGGTFNVMDWDWNGATLVGWRRRANTDGAIEQGRLLASALLARQGSIPRGCTVAASAAREVLGMRRGIRVAHVTLLEPAGFTHEAVFSELKPGSSACKVENYWSSGPIAYGNASGTPGVIDLQVDQTTPLVRMIVPTRSAHMGVVAWYIASVEDSSQPLGFNTSALLMP